jgi:hypothetical protein
MCVVGLAAKSATRLRLVRKSGAGFGGALPESLKAGHAILIRICNQGDLSWIFHFTDKKA